MIFWNVPFAASLLAWSARAIYSRGGGQAAGRPSENEQARCRIPATAVFSAISYDHRRSQRFRKRKIRESHGKQEERRARHECGQSDARTREVGGDNAAAIEPGGEDRADSVHDVSRQLYAEGFRGVRGNDARRERAARRGIHQRHAWIAAGLR